MSWKVLLNTDPIRQDFPEPPDGNVGLIGHQIPGLLVIGPPDDGHMTMDRMISTVSDVWQELALAPLNQDLGLDSQDIAKLQPLTPLGHADATEASVRQEDDLGGLGDHRTKDMEQTILKVVLGSVEVLVPIDGPQQKTGSPS